MLLGPASRARSARLRTHADTAAYSVDLGPFLGARPAGPKVTPVR